MWEDSDSSNSSNSSEEEFSVDPLAVSEIPLPPCAKTAPRMPPSLPVSLPFGWDNDTSRISSNIFQSLQQNPNVNVKMNDVQAQSINVNVVNNYNVPNFNVGERNPSSEVSKHKSSRNKHRSSRSRSRHSHYENRLNNINAIEPTCPDDSECKDLAFFENVNDDSNDVPMESASPTKEDKNVSRREKPAKVSKRVKRNTYTENCSCIKNKNIADMSMAQVLLKDTNNFARSEKTVKVSEKVIEESKTEENSNKSDSSISVESHEKTVTHTKKVTKDQASQTDTIIMVSKEVQEVLTDLEKHKVIEILRQNSRNDDDVIEIIDTDTDTQVEIRNKNVGAIDDSLMKFIVECSNKNKELVADMYSSAYSEASKMFHNDGWSAIWKIMVKAVRLARKKESNKAPATASNTPAVQTTPDTRESENHLREPMRTTQALQTSLLPPPPPPPPLPPMEVSTPYQRPRQPPQSATPMPPTLSPTPQHASAVPTPAHSVLQHKMLPQQFPRPQKFTIPRISPMTSHRNILDAQHKEISMQPVLREHGPTPLTRPMIAQKQAVHRQKRVESVQSARQQLAEHWSRHQMQATNPARDLELGNHVMYAAQATLAHLPPPAHPKPTATTTREQMVMYDQYKKLQLLKQKGQYDYRSVIW